MEETNLKTFLVENLHLISPSLAVYKADGVHGVDFPIGEKSIDILAVEDNIDLVVIRLDVSKTYKMALAELKEDIEWVKSNLAKSDQEVKGMIMTKIPSDDFRIAISSIDDKGLTEYQAMILLKKFSI